MTPLQVLILMGSQNDAPVMQGAVDVLKELGISVEMTVASAHRSPERVMRLLGEADARGVRVFIVGAGAAAHLGGVVAAHVTKPVIGVLSGLPVFGQPMNPMMMRMGQQGGSEPWAFITELQRDFTVKRVEMDADKIEDDIKVTLPEDIKYSCLPNEKSVETMLAEGELDAVFHSDFIKPFLAQDPRVARLFPDHKAEEIAYFKRTGIFPIMHVLGLRQELTDKYPWLAVNLFKAFNEAKNIAMKRMVDPRIVPLAWYRDAWEEQERILGPDPWQYGLPDSNRKVLETLIGYSHEQGLIGKRPRLEDLFLSVDQGRKRGGEFRI